MKIYSIANSPTFGYNKQLNNEVNKKLEATGNNNKKTQSSRTMAKDLLRMNKDCMQLEDKLRRAERLHNHAEVDFYKDLFINSKVSVTEKIDKRFPNSEYLSKELYEYQREVIDRQITDKNHWLVEITDELADIAASNLISKEDLRLLHSIKSKKNETSKSESPTETTPSTQESSQVPVKKSDDKDNTLVELFIPNEYSPTGFESVGAMSELKAELYDKIVSPLRFPEQAELDRIEYGKRFPRGIMFYGPSGCGKTFIMEAIAQESGVPLFKFKVSKVGSTLVNGSAIKVQEAYDIVKNKVTETGKPVLLMMDEMEGLTAKRDETGHHAEANKVVGTLLQIMDEARGDNVIILASTNFVNLIDPAIRRRIDNAYYFGLPDDETRDKILEMTLNKFPKGRTLALNPIERAKVVKATKGFAIRDLTVLVDKASDIARLDGRRDIVASDFDKPIAKNQDLKVNENLYKADNARMVIGFNK